ncbi:hypothetical protein ACF1GY_36245 [Streptomyces sp. NPDC014684]|uniref:hypothetical protein n=1 Tax=Streptomyces sp. NPDC014684 TaxID=3364880 RepID=UPI0036FF6F93
MHQQDHEEQALAITIGLLLLSGGSLLISCFTGPAAAFTLNAVPVLSAYTLPRLTRAFTLRRAVRRLLR